MSDWPYGEARPQISRIGLPILRPDPVYENERDAIQVLALVVAEWESDPMSVQCFDLRMVERGKSVIKTREALERRGDVPPLLTEGQR